MVVERAKLVHSILYAGDARDGAVRRPLDEVEDVGGEAEEADDVSNATDERVARAKGVHGEVAVSFVHVGGVAGEVIVECSLADREDENTLPPLEVDLAAEEEVWGDGVAESPEEVVTLLHVAESINCDRDAIRDAIEVGRSVTEMRAYGPQFGHDVCELTRRVRPLLVETLADNTVGVG